MTELQKLERQNRKLKRELLSSEKQVKRLTADNKWAGRMMSKMQKMMDDLLEDIRDLKEKAKELGV